MKKSNKMSKLISFVLAAVMCLCLSVSVFADDFSIDVDGITIESGIEGSTVMPRGAWVFTATCTKSSYSGSFTCDPDDGNRMTLTITNNGDNVIIANLVVDSTTIPAVEVEAGESTTITFSKSTNDGLTCTVKINLTTDDGESMNAAIKAWQYQYNV
ncbi:MAG: hypothetical protein LUG25_04535 [Oscillospiraceae bacterium]|nr:hypothetical protein [Oscillospiraceae bacterium]